MFRVLPIDDELRPEYWGVLDLPLLLGNQEVRSRAVDEVAEWLFAPCGFGPRSGAPYNYRSGRLLIGYSGSGSPDPAAEPLLAGEINALLTEPETYPTISITTGDDWAQIACTTDLNNAYVCMLLRAAQIVHNLIAEGSFGALDPVLTYSVTDATGGKWQATLRVTAPGYDSAELVGRWSTEFGLS